MDRDDQKLGKWLAGRARELEALRALMEEGPPGADFGGLVLDARTGEKRYTGAGAREFLRARGWTMHDESEGPKCSGMRGRVSWWFALDRDELDRLFREELGFTRDEFDRACRNGRPRAGDAEVRARVDRRLAELRRDGVDFSALARRLGCSRQRLIRGARRGKVLHPTR
jgi:hypothetical protein